ncbi:TfuA-like protein [Chelatococcus sp. SYSU_G07232]|uniref:TfuA-like protein n=1 Tax=Chelatococcus albus TaxID=3047466 RepID=A0ABT7AFQ5_9HYPH|nr:TfuA-like protein [Chelatococcus sp. SYSU_G07232]MDJ1158195.1 TfuA-like protein [Chelatococcus sp. SYSU_G07232]
MARPIAVFLGPSLPWREAACILDAVYLPPAEQGSIPAVLGYYRPRALVLIDGAFGRVPAVRHKEILWALDAGVPVYGAASMGALRAAELAGFGMLGHGLVYRWYRATPFADDDAIAVTMGPADLGAPALSEALINMRLSLRRAERQGVIARQTRQRLAGLAADTPFAERSYERLVDDARRAGAGEAAEDLDRLGAWLAGHAVDQKRADTLSLLRALAADPARIERDTARLTKRPSFAMTAAWADDLTDAGFDVAEIVARRAEGEHSSSGASE